MSSAGYFEAFRKNGAPTFYDALKTPFEADLVTSGLIFAFAILAFSFYAILPGIQGKERLFTFTRITVSLFIGAVILVTNFSKTWEVAETHTRTKYKAGTGQDVNVTIGAYIGFRGINITLKGEPDQIQGETIDYNENFNWEGLQGRIGFGPFAGRFNREFRAAQFRGLPLPILWAAEYFTFDGEGIRWGRHYRTAGWYAHIVLWLAFPLWLLTNIFFCVLLRYGAYFLTLTGLSMLTANIIWATIRNLNELVIPYTAEEMLEFSYGASFWLCLVTGILCVIMGVLIFLMDKLWPSQVATFFGVDVLQDSEFIAVEAEEEDDKNEAATTSGVDNDNGAAATAADEDDDEDDDDDIYTFAPALNPPARAPPAPHTPGDRAQPYVVRPRSAGRTFRSKEGRMTLIAQRPRRRLPPPLPARPGGQQTGDDTSSDDGDYYQNAPQIRMQALPHRN